MKSKSASRPSLPQGKERSMKVHKEVPIQKSRIVHSKGHPGFEGNKKRTAK